MKILVVSPKNKTVFNFRGDLIKAMIAQGHNVVVTGPNLDDIECVTELGTSRFIEMPLRKDKISVTGDVAYFRSLRGAIREEEPDIVFSYTPKPVIYGSLAAWSCGVGGIFPMVTGLGTVFRTSSVKNRILQLIMRVQYKLAFSVATRVFFQNPDDRMDFVSAGLVKDGSTSLLNGSGVNLQRFTIEPLPEQPTFLFIGRLIRDKGILEYLDACAVIKAKYPQARCLVVGAFDTNPSALSREALEPRLMSADIEYCGEVPDVRPYIAQCSVFVLPSYHEGTPRSVLEAMAMGRAVITTDAPGCRETVEDGVNGFLVAPGRADALASSMERLVQAPERAVVMGHKSRKMAELKYDVTKVNHEMMRAMGLLDDSDMYSMSEEQGQ